MKKIIFNTTSFHRPILFILAFGVMAAKGQTETATADKGSKHTKNEVWLSAPLTAIGPMEKFPSPALSYKRGLSKKSYLKIRVNYAYTNQQIVEESYLTEQNYVNQIRRYGFTAGYERRFFLSPSIHFLAGGEAGVDFYNIENTTRATARDSNIEAMNKSKSRSFNYAIYTGVIYHFNQRFATSLSYGIQYTDYHYNYKRSTGDDLIYNTQHNKIIHFTHLEASAIIKF